MTSPRYPAPSFRGAHPSPWAWPGWLPRLGGFPQGEVAGGPLLTQAVRGDAQVACGHEGGGHSARPGGRPCSRSLPAPAPPSEGALLISVVEPALQLAARSLRPPQCQRLQSASHRLRSHQRASRQPGAWPAPAFPPAPSVVSGGTAAWGMKQCLVAAWGPRLAQRRLLAAAHRALSCGSGR